MLRHIRRHMHEGPISVNRYLLSSKAVRRISVPFILCDIIRNCELTFGLVVFRFWADPASASPTRSGKRAASVSDTASAKRRPCAGSSRR